MKSGTSPQDLLYVAITESGGGFVSVFTYPQGERVGQLSGLLEPNGECGDGAGDVFVVAYANESYRSSTIYEYAHGGSGPVGTLSDPGIGMGCAIDPKAGDLAVANRVDYSNPYYADFGDVAVYHSARGKPTMYYSSEFSLFYYCAYDNKGRLYLSAFPYGGSESEAELVRLTPASKSIEAVNLNASLYLQPSVQWDGAHMTVTSQVRAESSRRNATTYQLNGNLVKQKIAIYQLKIKGGTATILGTTRLEKKSSEVSALSWIQGSTALGVFVQFRTYREGVGLWPYPGGGKPTSVLRRVANVNGSFVAGLAVSPATSR